MNSFNIWKVGVQLVLTMNLPAFCAKLQSTHLKLKAANMASNLRTVMTWKQAVGYFNSNVLPSVKLQHEADGIKDLSARRQAWNNWTDFLCKENTISDWQYENWSQPATCN